MSSRHTPQWATYKCHEARSVYSSRLIQRAWDVQSTDNRKLQTKCSHFSTSTGPSTASVESAGILVATRVLREQPPESEGESTQSPSPATAGAFVLIRKITTAPETGCETMKRYLYKSAESSSNFYEEIMTIQLSVAPVGPTGQP